MDGYYALRWQVLERDNFTCQYCGQKAPDAHLEVDHIVPRSEGGEDVEENLITACFACNRGKSALSIQAKRGKKNKPALPSELTKKQRIRDAIKSAGSLAGRL